jgi:hypothetical protein
MSLEKENNKTIMDKILTMRELAEYLPEKPNPETIRLWVRENKIPTLPREKGDRIFFYQDSVDFWVKNGRPEQGEMSDKEYSKIGMEENSNE